METRGGEEERREGWMGTWEMVVEGGRKEGRDGKESCRIQWSLDCEKAWFSVQEFLKLRMNIGVIELSGIKMNCPVIPPN